MSSRTIWLASAALAVLQSAAAAQTCSVPGQRPTVQSAVADPACSQVIVAAGTYPESVTVWRAVSLTGAGSAATLLTGRLVVEGAGADVAVDDLAVDTTGVRGGCYASAVVVEAGARLTPTGVVSRNAGGTPAAPCPLFADGFEAGGTWAWSSANPAGSPGKR